MVRQQVIVLLKESDNCSLVELLGCVTVEVGEGAEDKTRVLNKALNFFQHVVLVIMLGSGKGSI